MTDTSTTVNLKNDVPTQDSGKSLWTDARRKLLANRLAMISLAVIVVYVVLALLVTFGLLAGDWDESVGAAYQQPSWSNPLGTDIFGLSVGRKIH